MVIMNIRPWIDKNNKSRLMFPFIFVLAIKSYKTDKMKWVPCFVSITVTVFIYYPYNASFKPIIRILFKILRDAIKDNL